MMPRKITDYPAPDGLRLRRAGLLDGPFLGEIMRDKDILDTSGARRPVARSWFQIWWWMKKTYEYLYCIEIASTRIGFLGLYNLRSGEAGEVTLVIFPPPNRGRGYGKGAFALFVGALRQRLPVNKIIARVKPDNLVSLSFWRSLGFEDVQKDDGDMRVLSLDLKQRT